MLIFRICSKEELQQLFINKNDMGKNFENKKYLYFFKNKEDTTYLCDVKKCFVCTYDIPNYFLFRQEECKLDIDILNLNYLQRVEKIDEKCNFKMVYFNNFLNKYSKQTNNNNIEKIYNILMTNKIVEEINNNFKELLNLIPELKFIVGFEHKHPHHHLDVWNHTLYALSLSELDFDIRLSLLLHDIGKPFVCTEQDGIRHFHNHPKVSADMSYKILNRLGFKEEYVKKICYLIEKHDTEIIENDIDNDFNLIITLYLIQKCDALAHNPQKLEKRNAYLLTTKNLILKNKT